MTTWSEVYYPMLADLQTFTANPVLAHKENPAPVQIHKFEMLVWFFNIIGYCLSESLLQCYQGYEFIMHWNNQWYSKEITCARMCAHLLQSSTDGVFKWLQVEFLQSRLLQLKERIDDTEDLINIELDQRRNELVCTLSIL